MTYSINSLHQREKRVDLSRKIIYNSLSRRRKNILIVPDFEVIFHGKFTAGKYFLIFHETKTRWFTDFLLSFFCLLVEKISHRCKKSARDLKSIPDESGKCCSIVRIQFASQRCFEIPWLPRLPRPRAWILIAASHFSIERLKSYRIMDIPNDWEQIIWPLMIATKDERSINHIFVPLNSAWKFTTPTIENFAVSESINTAREWRDCGHE